MDTFLDNSTALQNPLDIFPIMEKESVDLIFTDVKMPGITGTELITRLNELYPTVHIVVLSAYPDYDYVRQCLKNGAFDYLLKPPKYNAILQITNRIENLVNSEKNILTAPMNPSKLGSHY